MHCRKLLAASYTITILLFWTSPTAGLRESAYCHTSFDKLTYYLIQIVTTLRSMSHGIDISRVVILHAFPISGIF